MNLVKIEGHINDTALPVSINAPNEQCQSNEQSNVIHRCHLDNIIADVERRSGFNVNHGRGRKGQGREGLNWLR